MTPYDLRTWRLPLGLTQTNAARLFRRRAPNLSASRNTARFPRGSLPGYVSAAVYGANTAIREAEKLLDVIEWPRDGTRYWNSRLSGDKMRWRTLFTVARHILEHGKLTGRYGRRASNFISLFQQNLGIEILVYPFHVREHAPALASS